MEKYKPGYMGKVIPADDPAKLTDFVTNKYDAFSKVYDACKDQSEKIDDIKVVESSENSSSDTLSVKVSADKGTLDNIQKATETDSSISVNGDVITAKGND